MTPRVQLQVKVIDALFRLVEKEPDACLRQMVKGYQGFPYTRLCDGDYTLLRRYDFREPRDDSWDWNKALVEILLEQVDDSGPKVVIRNLLGSKLLGYGRTQTLQEYLQRGNGNDGNWVRTECSAQPGALRVGDILETGELVLSEPREGGNGRVLIHLEGGLRGTWIAVPARIPIALRQSFDGTPESLI